MLYVEDLIGPDTVNTIPPATFDAFRDHGKPRPAWKKIFNAAHDTMQGSRARRHFDEAVTDKLTEDGVKLFAEAFDKLLAAVENASTSRPSLHRSTE